MLQCSLFLPRRRGARWLHSPDGSLLCMNSPESRTGGAHDVLFSFLCDVSDWHLSAWFQPPPAIMDKQLDEREHTVEEWKGAFFNVIDCFYMLLSFIIFNLWWLDMTEYELYIKLTVYIAQFFFYNSINRQSIIYNLIMPVFGIHWIKLFKSNNFHAHDYFLFLIGYWWTHEI